MEGCKDAGIPAFGTLWDFVSTVVSFLDYDADFDVVISLAGFS